VADNLLNQNFNPVGSNQIWADDITYLLTGEGWMYLAIVMDLYSRRIVGWFISKRMTTDLINKALIKAYNLRRPPKGLVFHSDRRSQYTSQRYRQLLESYGVRASMGDVGACWNNVMVKRFLAVWNMTGYLKLGNQRVSFWQKMSRLTWGITTLKGCILRTVISHLLTMKALWRKCPVRVDQNRLRDQRGARFHWNSP
jgi:transposase InsO family protein